MTGRFEELDYDYTGKRKTRAYLPGDWRECFGTPVENHEESYKIDLAQGYIGTGKAGEM